MKRAMWWLFAIVSEPVSDVDHLRHPDPVPRVSPSAS